MAEPTKPVELIRHDMLHKEPLATVIGLAQDAAVKLLEHTNHHVLRALSFTREFMLRSGIPRGARIMSAVGYVELRNEEKGAWITGVHLYRSGDRTVVAIERDGEWTPIISEPYDNAFSHIKEL